MSDAEASSTVSDAAGCSIVSTAEKARDAAKRGRGPWVPSPHPTLARLLAALAEQEALEDQVELEELIVVLPLVM